ncbi:MAG: DUF6040 family protein [Lachnospiraceae bacterium]
MMVQDKERLAKEQEKLLFNKKWLNKWEKDLFNKENDIENEVEKKATAKVQEKVRQLEQEKSTHKSKSDEYETLIGEELDKIQAEVARRSEQLQAQLNEEYQKEYEEKWAEKEKEINAWAEKTKHETDDYVAQAMQELVLHKENIQKEKNKVDALKAAYPMVTAFSVVYGIAFTAMTAAFKPSIINDTVSFWGGIYKALSDIPAYFGANSVVCTAIGIAIYVLLGFIAILGTAIFLKKKWPELPHKITVTVILADIALTVAYSDYISSIINVWVMFFGVMIVYFVIAAGNIFEKISDFTGNIRFKLKRLQPNQIMGFLFPIIVILMIVFAFILT